MKKHFQQIGIVGHPRHESALETHIKLYNWLKDKGYQVLVDADVAKCIAIPEEDQAELNLLAQTIDLAIVIGGDGNMLRAARAFCGHDIKIIGINRGTLGFLTDIEADEFIPRLEQVLQGHYVIDSRFLLTAEIRHDEQVLYSDIAINEVVLHPTKVAHMIEFEVEIDDAYAFSQRADGLIIATPTGSTAYSLSAGGPIVEPNLEAIIVSPMFPHSLSVRPLVISGNSLIRLRCFNHEFSDVQITCDSQAMYPIQAGNNIVIKKSEQHFQLIHFKDYSYFNTLSHKLGWSRKLY